MTDSVLPLSHLPNLPSGPVLYILLAAVVVASGVPIFALVVAAEPILMTVIVLDGNGRLSIVALLAVTVAASVLGDVISYGLGRWFGLKLLRARIVRRSRRRIIGAQHNLQHQSMMSALFIQRWIPPTRGLVPALLGATERPVAVFTAFSALAAAVWGPVIVVGSYVGGPELMLAMPVVMLVPPALRTTRRLLVRRRNPDPTAVTH